MSIGIIIKRILSSVFMRTKILDKKMHECTGRDIVILTYHRVIDSAEAEVFSMSDAMCVKPATFDMQLRFLKKYFHIIGLESIFNDKGEIFKSPDGKPLCLITFDDGWDDLYRNAFPILKKHNVPATVFISTGVVGTNVMPPACRLGNMMKQKKNPGSRNSDIPEMYIRICDEIESIKGNFNMMLEKAIVLTQELNEKDQEIVISELSKRWGVESMLEGRVFLNWEEVFKMHDSGLISIGSHTVAHDNMIHLTTDKMAEELNKSMHMLIEKKLVNPAFVPFCYPYGAYDEIVEKEVIKAGYAMAVTCERGWYDADASPFRINRICMHEDVAGNEAMLGCYILDLFSRKLIFRQK